MEQDIYFDINKKAYAYKFPEAICHISGSLWEIYADTPYWDIIENTFVQLKTPEEIAIIKAAIIERAQLVKNLDDTDFRCFEYIDGVITEEQYLEYKSQRNAWRARIAELDIIIGS